MRHGKKFNHLGRKAAHRKAMLANMACSLIEHKRIKTTVAKAKALRIYVEPLITKSKNDTTHSRRVVFSYLKSKDAVRELFGEVSNKVADRPGGYTRILKIGNRLGDNAEMAIIELVDFNELAPGKAAKGKAKIRRRGGKNTATATSAAPKADDLKKIEGIGPKIAQLLNEGGITTFAQLAASEPEAIKEILLAGGDRFKMHNPTTWPKQAEMAAEGKWDELKAWQDELDGGKEVN